MIKVKELRELLSNSSIDDDAIVTFVDDVIQPKTSLIVNRMYDFLPNIEMVEGREVVPVITEEKGIKFLEFKKTDLLMARRMEMTDEDPFLSEYRLNTILHSTQLLSGIFTNQIELDSLSFKYVAHPEGEANKSGYYECDNYRHVALQDTFTKAIYIIRAKMKIEEDEVTGFTDIEVKLFNSTDLYETDDEGDDDSNA